MDAPFWTAIPFLIIVIIASSTGAIFKPDAWYRNLDKPGWTPRDWVFPVVWSVLYVLMAYAAWRVWQVDGIGLALGLWGVQLALNMLWSLVFFGMKQVGLAFVELVALWLAVAAMIVAFAQVDLLSGLILLPYLLWVTIAGVLNFSILRRLGRPA